MLDFLSIFEKGSSMNDLGKKLHKADARKKGAKGSTSPREVR